MPSQITVSSVRVHGSLSAALADLVVLIMLLLPNDSNSLAYAGQVLGVLMHYARGSHSAGYFAVGDQ